MSRRAAAPLLRALSGRATAPPLSPPALALTFPGQGAQRPGMCADVYTAWACARHAVHEVEDAAGTRLRPAMFEQGRRVRVWVHHAWLR